MNWNYFIFFWKIFPLHQEPLAIFILPIDNIARYKFSQSSKFQNTVQTTLTLQLLKVE